MNGKDRRLDALRDAFAWRGGSELIVKMSLDRGRPAKLEEMVDVFQCLLWTATAAEALTNYAAWIVRDKPTHPKFSAFHEWVEGLPDPTRLHDPMSAGGIGWEDSALDEWSPFLESQDIAYNQLVQLIGWPGKLDRGLIGPMDLALSLQLLAVFQENPTHSWTSVNGSLIALGVAASIWGSVALGKTLTEDDCHKLVFQAHERQHELIMGQARLQGTMTPVHENALANLDKATQAMHKACGAVFQVTAEWSSRDYYIFSLNRGSSAGSSAGRQQGASSRDREGDR
jgi:hypothetical protein